MALEFRKVALQEEKLALEREETVRKAALEERKMALQEFETKKKLELEEKKIKMEEKKISLALEDKQILKSLVERQDKIINLLLTTTCNQV